MHSFSLINKLGEKVDPTLLASQVNDRALGQKWQLQFVLQTMSAIEICTNPFTLTRQVLYTTQEKCCISLGKKLSLG